MTTVMCHDKVLVKALIETEGNLSKSNSISRLAEEMGTLFFRMPLGQSAPLRDAVNGFVYVPPSSLPAQSSFDKLSSEPHNFSRIFTGAVYEIMITIYLKLVAGGMDGLVALRQAGDLLSTYIFKAALIVPASANFFQNFARSILIVDQQIGNNYQDIIMDVFSRRNLAIGNSMQALGDSGPGRIEIKNVREKTILGDVTAMAGEGITVELPLDEFRRYNSRDELIEEKIPSRDDTYAIVSKFVDHLQSREQIGKNKEFEVVDGHLIRNHITCGGAEYVFSAVEIFP